MARIFQYGSNMCTDRLNHEDRLAGDAIVVEIARTVEPYELAFTVWSRTNKCAAADIVPRSDGRSIYGVVYDVPEYLLSPDTAKEKNRRSLDAIEGEGTNYQRERITLWGANERKLTAMTYVVKNRQPNLRTSLSYVQHILNGLEEHNIPEGYRQYVRAQIVLNNPDLASRLDP